MKLASFRVLSAFRALAALAFVPMAFAPAPVLADQFPLWPFPFTSTLSNNTPLAFGMSVQDAANALQSPLSYVSGRPGNEVFVAALANTDTGLFPRGDKLFLQFRKGRLTGWKGDWSRKWMWQ